MSQDFACGSERAAKVAEVQTLTQDRPGGTPSGAYVVVMDRSAPMDMAIITALARFTRSEAAAARMEERTKDTMGMGLCAGVKCTLTTTPIPNTEISSSVETRSIYMESGQSDNGEGEELYWGGKWNSGLIVSIFVEDNIMRGSATSLVTHSS